MRLPGAAGGRDKFRVGPPARRTDAEGVTFASRGEMMRWQELRFLERVGEITHLERQPAFDIHVPHHATGAPVKVCRYTADFRYREGGEIVVEDFKSPATKTSVYRLKKRLMAAVLGIEIRESGKGG